MFLRLIDVYQTIQCMNFRTLISLALILCASISHGQIVTKKSASDKLMKCYQKGLSFSKTGDQENAIKHFNKALKKNEQFIDAHIRKGVALEKLERYSDAEMSFAKALELDPNYDARVHYTLADVLWKQKKYKEALPYYNNYLTRTEEENALTRKANNKIKNAKVIIPGYKNPVPFSPIALSANINTSVNSEYLPSLSADEELFVYTVRERGQEDLYVSKKDEEGNWLKGEALPINTQDNEAAQTVSADGSLLIFTMCSKQISIGSCDLFYSYYFNNKWSVPLNMGEQINTIYWESQPSLTDNGNTLYFSSNRPGGMGSKDIYVSHFKNGNWSKPKNVGPSINTAGDEESPFVHQDGETMYFMSNNHPGYGDFDLFISRKNKDEWSSPENLGYPINSPANEGALIVSLDGSTGYYATDRKYLNDDFKKPETDIYQFELYPEIRPNPVTYVKAIVKDAASNKEINALVEIVDLETSEVVYSYTTKGNNFLACLPAGRNYGMNVNEQGYLFYSDNFELKNKENFKEPYILEINLNPIPNKVTVEPKEEVVYETPIILKNVFFETGSAELKDESTTELNSLHQLLLDNPSIRIQINGHTDDVGSEEDNLALSLDRAKAVYNFILNKGISSSRLAYKGFGESQPIDSNETDAGRKNNRRTEFILIR